MLESSQFLALIEILIIFSKSTILFHFQLKADRESTYQEQTIIAFPVTDGHDEVADVGEVLQPEIMAASDFRHTLIELVRAIVIQSLDSVNLDSLQKQRQRSIRMTLIKLKKHNCFLFI